MFANKYLEKNNNVPLVNQLPDDNLGIIVVIPCLREPNILGTLNSLQQCKTPGVKTEVIVLINHSEIAPENIKHTNRQTKTKLEDWIGENSNRSIWFYAVGPVELKKKWAGAGLARKRGMDEAVRRFNLLGKTDGIIVSLDADTLVAENYLVEIERYFYEKPQNVGATIDFEHQKDKLETKQLRGIELYEMYLDYYKRALDYSGYPYSMFTIGSAFAVRALAYVKRGGMNRRQAGEDFYFLQNLVQIGEVGEIQSTKVFPSARLSDRVPFGTGPILQKWMTGEEDLTLTYDFSAFSDLKCFFDVKDQFFKIDEAGFRTLLTTLPDSVSRFISEDNFWAELTDLNKNCSAQKSFQSRFFQKFNAFKILKYLNFAHEKRYEKADLEKQVLRLNEEQKA